MLICFIQNISKKISSRDFFSKNDLFVCIECNGKKYRTMTVWDKNKPEWNTYFLIDNTHGDKAVLTCYLYDEDKYGKNEIIKKESIVVNEKFSGSCAGVNIECFFGEIQKNDDIKKISDKNIKLNEENIKLNDDNNKLIEQNNILQEEINIKNTILDEVKDKCNNIIKIIN